MLPGFAMIIFGICSLVEISYGRKDDGAVSIGYTHIFYFEPFLLFYYHQFRVCFMLYLKFTLIQRGTGATVLAAGVMEIGWVMIIGCAVSNFTLSFHIFSSIYHFHSFKYVIFHNQIFGNVKIRYDG